MARLSKAQNEALTEIIRVAHLNGNETEFAQHGTAIQLGHPEIGISASLSTLKVLVKKGYLVYAGRGLYKLDFSSLSYSYTDPPTINHPHRKPR